MDHLGRYYTKESIGDLLVNQMVGIDPARILDLGAGGGCLSFAASSRWASAEMLTVDIDHNASSRLTSFFAKQEGIRHSHIRADALSVNLPKLIGAQSIDLDAAVCNPPFIKPKWRKGFGEILEDAGFSGCLPLTGDADAALLFLAQNLRLLNENAMLGIILPDSLVSAKKYLSFRTQLIARYRIHRTIRLPRCSFNNTDALAYIVIVSKTKSDATIPLQCFDIKLGLQDELLVNTEEAIERLDFNYHSQKNKLIKKSNNIMPLSSLFIDLKRGTVCSSQRNDYSTEVLHTTNFKKITPGSWINIEENELVNISVPQGVVTAIQGDILIARVGRNLENKIIGIANGSTIVTDCIYVLRLPKKYRATVLSQLSSLEGRDWLASRAYGVSAKQLTKSDLLEFPVNLS